MKLEEVKSYCKKILYENGISASFEVLETNYKDYHIVLVKNKVYRIKGQKLNKVEVVAING